MWFEWLKRPGFRNIRVYLNNEKRFQKLNIIFSKQKASIFFDVKTNTNRSVRFRHMRKNKLGTPYVFWIFLKTNFFLFSACSHACTFECTSNFSYMVNLSKTFQVVSSVWELIYWSVFFAKIVAKVVLERPLS